MEQHPVPQHIASFEFKLFGNLTVRQFVTLAIPMSIAVAIFFSSLPTFIRYPLAIFFGGLGGFAALVPIGGRPLDKWVVAFMKAISSPTQRVWVKEAKIPEFLNIVISTPHTSRAVEPITTQDRERLFSYLRTVPKGQVSPYDVKEQVALSRLGLSYEEGAAGGKLPPPIMWATPSPVGPGRSLPQVSTLGAAASTAPVPMQVDEGLPADTSKYQGAMADSLPAISDKPRIRTKISNHAKAFALPGLEKKLNKIMEEKKTRQPIQLVSTPQLQLASETNFSIENVIPISTPGRRVRLVHGVGKTRARKLHFAPPSGFDLANLPIRGEARFEVSEELKKRLGGPMDEDKEAAIDRMFAKGGEPVAAEPAIPVPAAPAPKVEPVIKQVPKPQAGHIFVKPQVKIQPQGVKMREEPRAEVDSKISSFATNVGDHIKPAEVLSRAQIVPLTNKPNVLSGLVASAIGVPLEGVIITVRDHDGVPVRALKTNKLGQFLSATPLLAGEYTLEIEGQQNRFEPVTLTLAGEVLSPLEIKAIL